MMAASIRLLAGALVGSALCGALSAAQFDEYPVKSAFLVNIVQFIDWPASRLRSGEEFVTCVLGDSPVTPRLTALSGQLIKGHPFRVRTVSPPMVLNGCHVLFVPAAASDQLRELVVRNRGTGVLFVSERQDTAQPESVVNLFVAENRVAFDINLDVAAAQELTVSSKLLRLAGHVYGVAAVPKTTSEGGAAGRGGRSN